MKGIFGTIYTQFKDKPREAIKHLIKVKEGECSNALYRKEVGYIDIVWGEHDINTNNGFGLSHIIAKHGKEIKQLGFKVEDFIPIVVMTGDFKISKTKERVLFEGSMFRIVIGNAIINTNKKAFVLTAFDLRKKAYKKGINGTIDGIDLKKSPLYFSPIHSANVTNNSQSMITKTNYKTEINKIGVSNLPPLFQKLHDMTTEAIDTNSKDDDVNRVVNSYIEKLNAWASKNKPAAEPKAKVRISDKPIRQKKEKDKVFEDIKKATKEVYPNAKVVLISKGKNATSKPKVKKQQPGKAVELISPEVQFIKSYANLHGKTIDLKRASNLLMALQKAITDRKIKSGSKYETEIMNIQEGLVKICDNLESGGTVKIDLDDKARASYFNIATSEHKMKEVGLLKRFISLGFKKKSEIVRGKKIAEHAAKLYHDIEIMLDLEPHYKTQLNQAKKYLRDFLDSDTYLKLPERELSGLGNISEAIVGGAIGAIVQYWIHRKLKHQDKVELAGVHQRAIKGSRKNNDNTFSSKNYKHKKDWSGHGAWHGGLKGIEDMGVINIPEKKQKNPGLMTVNEVKKQSFKTLGINGEWKNVIGDIAPPTSIMFTGIGGSGKSTAALKLCETLDQLGQNCLYIAGEQFNSPTFTDLLNRINLKVNRMVIAKDLSALSEGNFNTVAIDSKDSFNLSVEDYRNLRKRYPHLIWIVISQGIIETKNGKTWTGDEAWRNEMETILNVSNGTVSQTGKNRWGGKGTMKVY